MKGVALAACDQSQLWASVLATEGLIYKERENITLEKYEEVKDINTDKK